ncbi:hypothetical protein F3Y22_tig00110388pilonHSYRG00401 [Hibiscus syriacus]|uniref:Terpene synthase metal-binding domain-containing protein n=1 Tax=Hibiscus syriacus TaxID=106335 RepID=A0A6A3ARH0_HIBSY|nr:hypothetical protein F3Y22_tig00110388pilonHSYRG00401 [Hibiscus syriacus]
MKLLTTVSKEKASWRKLGTSRLNISNMSIRLIVSIRFWPYNSTMPWRFPYTGECQGWKQVGTWIYMKEEPTSTPLVIQEELKRGDVAKSIQCYMREHGVSEEATRQQIKNLMREAWKKINVQRGSACPLTSTVREPW